MVLLPTYEELGDAYHQPNTAAARKHQDTALLIAAQVRGAKKKGNRQFNGFSSPSSTPSFFKTSLLMVSFHSTDMESVIALAIRAKAALLLPSECRPTGLLHSYTTYDFSIAMLLLYMPLKIKQLLQLALMAPTLPHRLSTAMPLITFRLDTLHGFAAPSDKIAFILICLAFDI
eukprot:jgi/Picsp_1/3711/NSC_06547-R1_---NA---